MENELYHYGRKGMKWGQHIFGEERSYQRKLKTRLKDYDSQHKDRSKKDNYTIALNKEARKLQNNMMRDSTLASFPTVAGWIGSMAMLTSGAGPIFIAPLVAGASTSVAINTGSKFVNKHRFDTINDIYDEYNIPNAQRVVNT